MYKYYKIYIDQREIRKQVIYVHTQDLNGEIIKSFTIAFMMMTSRNVSFLFLSDID